MKEEARMQYLEERRRKIEDKIAENAEKKQQQEEEKRKKVEEARHKATSRVRMGNFMWHNGKFGFYDQVRKEAVGYVEYEDEWGRPYYYDLLSHTTTYKRPDDGPVRHYIDIEREDYDAEHGEGAYDLMQADRAFKDGVNRDGGYWDEKTGQWVIASGYYDENYEWVQFEGYYDENGKYILYPKITGDLAFMV